MLQNSLARGIILMMRREDGKRCTLRELRSHLRFFHLGGTDFFYHLTADGRQR